LVHPFGLSSYTKWVQILKTDIDEASTWYVPSVFGNHDVGIGLLPGSFSGLSCVPCACSGFAFGTFVRKDRVTVTDMA
jgi:hypothetical protein